MTTVICDDEAPVRSLIKSYILKQSAEQTILEYASGESLLTSLRASDEQPDILFLDITFETGVDGMEVAAAVRAMYDRKDAPEFSALPAIIFVTGDEHRMPEAFHVHAFQYIVKPIHEVTFLAVIIFPVFLNKLNLLSEDIKSAKVDDFT